MDFLSPDLLALLFAVGLFAGFIDSIAGGGGLVTIPVLLAVGVPPAAALATNKLQGTFGSFSAALHFYRLGELDLRRLWPWFAVAVVASALGAVTVQAVDPSFLRTVLPVLLVTIALYLLLSPGIGAVDAHQRLGYWAFGLTIVPAVAYYDGFFGPATGSFFALALVGVMGFNLRKATAHTKLLNFGSNVGSLVLFIIGGKVLWAIGLAMGVGQFLGARLGAAMVMKKGARLVRPLLVVVCLATTAKLVNDDHGVMLAAFLTELLGR